MAGYKRTLTIKEVLEKIDEDKSYFDKLYEALNHYTFISQGKSSDIRINFGSKTFVVGGTNFNEKASKVLRHTRAELRKLNNYIDCFFENCSE